MVVVSGINFFMIYKYNQKYESYKLKTDPKRDDFDDIAIARYSLFIQNLPRDMGVEDLEDRITE